MHRRSRWKSKLFFYFLLQCRGGNKERERGKRDKSIFRTNSVLFIFFSALVQRIKHFPFSIKMNLSAISQPTYNTHTNTYFAVRVFWSNYFITIFSNLNSWIFFEIGFSRNSSVKVVCDVHKVTSRKFFFQFQFRYNGINGNEHHSLYYITNITR